MHFPLQLHPTARPPCSFPDVLSANCVSYIVLSFRSQVLRRFALSSPLEGLSKLQVNYESGCRGSVDKVFDSQMQGRGFNPQSRHGGVGQILL